MPGDRIPLPRVVEYQGESEAAPLFALIGDTTTALPPRWNLCTRDARCGFAPRDRKTEDDAVATDSGILSRSHRQFSGATPDRSALLAVSLHTFGYIRSRGWYWLVLDSTQAPTHLPNSKRTYKRDGVGVHGRARGPMMDFLWVHRLCHRVLLRPTMALDLPNNAVRAA